MKISGLISVGLILSGLGGAAGCAEISKAALREPEMTSRLQRMYPNTRISAVRAAEVDGLYEVVMGENVAYTDAQGRYFVFGHLYDMLRQVDLTALRPPEERRVVFPQALLSNAIKNVKGSGARVFAVFSDPDCVFCRRLEAEFEKLNDVTIYTFLHPLEAINPGAKSKAISIWCAPDRVKAWSEAVLAGTAMPLIACANPVNDNLVLGGALGVVGTPTIIGADGRVLQGAVSAAALEAWLGKAETSGRVP